MPCRVGSWVGSLEPQRWPAWDSGENRFSGPFEDENKHPESCCSLTSGLQRGTNTSIFLGSGASLVGTGAISLEVVGRIPKAKVVCVFFCNVLV